MQRAASYPGQCRPGDRRNEQETGGIHSWSADGCRNQGLYAAIAQYPPERKRSAVLPLLHLWQERFGFISDEGINWIADKLELQPINILELVTFYPMLRQKSAGKTHIRVCRTLSCAMAGS